MKKEAPHDLPNSLICLSLGRGIQHSWIFIIIGIWMPQDERGYFDKGLCNEGQDEGRKDAQTNEN
jgi:hypothetical protein